MQGIGVATASEDVHWDTLIAPVMGRLVRNVELAGQSTAAVLVKAKLLGVKMRIAARVLLSIILLSGCTDAPIHVTSTSHVPPSLRDGWSAAYNDSKAEVTLTSAAPGPMPFGSALTFGKANLDSGKSDPQVVYWSGNVPVAIETQLRVNGSAVFIMVLNPSQPALFLPQLFGLPHILESDLSAATLPRFLPLAQWRGLNHGDVREFPFVVDNGTVAWRIVYDMGDGFWPSTVVVEAPCHAWKPPGCPPLPASSGKWRLVSTQVGRGAEWAMGVSLPESLWAPHAGTQVINGRPQMSPGGPTTPLDEAIRSAREQNADVRDFLEHTTDWQVGRAAFSGSNLTGRTHWSIGLESPSSGRGIQFDYDTEIGGTVHGLADATVSNVRTYPLRTWPAGPLVLPRWEELMNEVKPCGDSRFMHLTTMTYTYTADNPNRQNNTAALFGVGFRDVLTVCKGHFELKFDMNTGYLQALARSYWPI